MKKNVSLATNRSTPPSPAALGQAIRPLAPSSCAPSRSPRACGAKLKEARVSSGGPGRQTSSRPGRPAPGARSAMRVREGTAVRTGLESRAELTLHRRDPRPPRREHDFQFRPGHPQPPARRRRHAPARSEKCRRRADQHRRHHRRHHRHDNADRVSSRRLLQIHHARGHRRASSATTASANRSSSTPGQMLIVNPKGKGLPEPVDVDLDRLMKTSLLITGFGPLPSLDLIAQAILAQTKMKNDGGLIETNLVIFGGGTLVSKLDPTNANAIDQANASGARPLQSQTMTPTPPPITPTPPPITPTPPPITPTPTPMTPTPTPMTPTPTPMTPTPTPITPTPSPSKYGTPTPISSPVPYVISSATTIETDPTITTNGVTDYGKIYRGPTLDGPASVWFFTATSAFDTKIGLDAFFVPPVRMCHWPR